MAERPETTLNIIVSRATFLIFECWQEPITRSLHPDYILESTFARIFLFLEYFVRRTRSPVRDCLWRNTITLFWLDGIMNSREFERLKIKRYGQRLSPRVYMGDWWVPGVGHFKSFRIFVTLPGLVLYSSLTKRSARLCTLSMSFICF